MVGWLDNLMVVELNSWLVGWLNDLMIEWSIRWEAECLDV